MVSKLILRNITDMTESELLKEFGECCYTCDNLSSTQFDENIKESSSWCKKRGIDFHRIKVSKEIKCCEWVKINHSN